MEEFKERRRAPRVVIAGRVGGRIKATIEASLLDVSATGALVEHAELLRPGIRYELIIHSGTGDLGFKVKVVRSVVSRSIPTEKGEAELIYRSGLEFIDPSDEELERLENLVRSFEPGGGATLRRLHLSMEIRPGGDPSTIPF